MMNEELTLISFIKDENEMGDTVRVPVRSKVLCSVESVTRSEHYSAASHDLQPEIVFIVNRFDYDNQSKIEYKNKEYNVIRSYLPKGRTNPNPMDIDRLELVCEGVD